jgi:hypothetical protein
MLITASDSDKKRIGHKQQTSVKISFYDIRFRRLRLLAIKLLLVGVSKRETRENSQTVTVNRTTSEERLSGKTDFGLSLDFFVNAVKVSSKLRNL